GWLALRAFDFDRLKCGGNLRARLCGNLVLNREDVFHLAIETFGPQLTALCCIQQLGDNTYTLVVPADAAAKDVADSQFAAGPANIDFVLSVGSSRTASNDEEPGHAAKRCREFLGNAVGKIVLAGVIAEVGERKDRNRYLVRYSRREGGSDNDRRFADFAVGKMCAARAPPANGFGE